MDTQTEVSSVDNIEAQINDLAARMTQTKLEIAAEIALFRKRQSRIEAVGWSLAQLDSQIQASRLRLSSALAECSNLGLSLSSARSTLSSALAECSDIRSTLAKSQAASLAS